MKNLGAKWQKVVKKKFKQTESNYLIGNSPINKKIKKSEGKIKKNKDHSQRNVILIF